MTDEMDLQIKRAIKCIINLKCRTGASLKDIQDEYEEMVGPWPLPNHSLQQNYDLVNTIEGVHCVESRDGTFKWFIGENTKMKHLTGLIINQRERPPKRQQTANVSNCTTTSVNSSVNGSVNNSVVDNASHNATNGSIESNDCFFKDNIAYKRLRRLKLQEQGSWENGSKRPAGRQRGQTTMKETYDAQLVGDDFFVSLASRKDASIMDGSGIKNGIRCSDSCLANMSIQAAAHGIQRGFKLKSSTIILNVGTVDILRDKPLSKIRSDFRQLMNACKSKHVRPIITTLLPFSVTNHLREAYQKLFAFNKFLIDTYSRDYLVIDLWSMLVRPSGCIQSGTNSQKEFDEPTLFWNYKGSMLAFNVIKFKLDEFLGKKNATIGV